MTLILLISVTAGYLAGGRLRNLANLHLRGVVLLLAAVCAPLVAPLLAGNGAAGAGTAVSTGMVLSLVLVAVFLALNLAREHSALRIALAVMGFGWLLNAIAIIANGGMASPAEVLGGSPSSVNIWIGPHAAEHLVLDSTTRLPWLADAIVLRLPGYLVSISIGDLVLAAGVAVFFVVGMRTTASSTEVPSASAAGRARRTTVPSSTPRPKD